MLGKTREQGGASDSLTLCNGANEEFGSKSLQIPGKFRFQFVLSNFTLHPCLWYLISLGTAVMFFKQQTWKPIGFGSVQHSGKWFRNLEFD